MAKSRSRRSRSRRPSRGRKYYKSPRTGRRRRLRSSRVGVTKAWKARNPKAKWACPKGSGLKGFKKKTAAKRVCSRPIKVR